MVSKSGWKHPYNDHLLSSCSLLLPSPFFTLTQQPAAATALHPRSARLRLGFLASIGPHHEISRHVLWWEAAGRFRHPNGPTPGSCHRSLHRSGPQNGGICGPDVKNCGARRQNGRVRSEGGECKEGREACPGRSSQRQREGGRGERRRYFVGAPRGRGRRRGAWVTSPQRAPSPLSRLCRSVVRGPNESDPGLPRPSLVVREHIQEAEQGQGGDSADAVAADAVLSTSRIHSSSSFLLLLPPPLFRPRLERPRRRRAASRLERRKGRLTHRGLRCFFLPCRSTAKKTENEEREREKRKGKRSKKRWGERETLLWWRLSVRKKCHSFCLQAATAAAAAATAPGPTATTTSAAG